MLDSDEPSSSEQSTDNPIDAINNEKMQIENLVLQNQVTKIVTKIKSGNMTAFDWRLMYGVFRSNFKKHDHYTNLKHTPLNKTLAKLGSKVLERIKKIKT